MAVVVLTIAAGGVLIPFTSAASVHVEGSRRTTAAKLAADLVEEITVSFENVSDSSSYNSALNFWDGFYESEGNVTKIWGIGSYTGDVYKYFSRSAACKEASVGSGRNVTSLGVWITVTVKYDGREMATLKTLVSMSNKY